jgi:hypothetical protein
VPPARPRPAQGPALGRRPADPDRLARTVTLRLTGAAPAHPPAADYLAGVPAWCLGANTQFGTCGPVYVANSAILTWQHLLREAITVSDADIFDLYRRSGNPGFDPATGDGDGGVDMTVMLSALVKGGLWITHPGGARELAKPLCFAKHGTGIETVHAVTSIFGHCGLGLDLDVAQQAQTDRGLWDHVAGSRPWGGHATCGGAYTSASGPGQPDVKLVTWAAVVGTTDAFLANQLPEAYVIVWPPLWSNPAFQAGVDQAALASDYQQVTGRPFPIPRPAPVVPLQADTADQALAAALPAGWATARHYGPTKTAAGAVRRWAVAKGVVLP